MQTSNSDAIHTSAIRAEVISDISASYFDDPLRLAKEFLVARHMTAQHQTLHHHRGRWLRWNSLSWEELDESLLTSEITFYVSDRLKEVAQQSKENAPPKRMSTKLTSQVLTFLKDLCILNSSRDHFSWLSEPTGQADRNYITFLNGILHVPSYLSGADAFQPLTADWFSPVHLSYDFVPAALCPRWEEFVAQVLPEAQLPALLQELFGYCLIPDCRYEKAFLLHGNGRNGKSTIADVLTWLVGDKNVSHVSMERFADQFALVASENKLVNIMAEITKVPASVEGVFKEYTSGKPVSTRNLYGKTYSMTPTARCVCTANTLPPIKDHTDGFWRRLVLLPFTYQVPLAGVDTQLGGKLRTELPGIALWALRGLERLRQQNEFSTPAAAATALEEYRDLGNPLGSFLKENFIPDAAAEDLLLRDVYSLYEETVLKEDTTLFKPSQADIVTELTRLFPKLRVVRKIPFGGDKKVRFVKGLRQAT